jgi:integrase
MLNNKAIDGSKPKDKPYKLADGQGLYLYVSTTGIKSWRADFVEDGKRKTKTFGQYPDIGVANARRLNFEFKDRDIEKSKPTFNEIKEEWYLSKIPSLKNLKHRQQVKYRVDTFASPLLGDKKLDEIKRVDLVEVVQDVQIKGLSVSAHMVGIYIRQILDFAMDHGYIESHPGAGLSRVLKPAKSVSMPCIDVSKAGKLMRDINEYQVGATKQGLILVAHTFVRTKEIRYMKWSDIKDKTFWVIPAEIMKMSKPHVVPLSQTSLKALEVLREINGRHEYVFQSPHRKNQPISENTLLDGLYAMGYKHKMTVHGFRALASTVLNEQSPFSHDVIERQLAHKERDEVRAAYNRAEYLDERIKLMSWWSEWLNKSLAHP